VKRAFLLVPGFLGAILVFLTACGGGDDGAATSTSRVPSTPTTVSSATPTTTEPLSTMTVVPTIVATSMSSGDINLDITPDGDQLKFSTEILTVTEGATVVITLENSSSIFQHNLVVVQSGAKDSVAAAGAIAGPTNDYVPTGDVQVVANTKLLNAGETGEVLFTAPVAGNYQFVCTFPGHNFTMFGDFIVN
jgi:azurin